MSALRCELCSAPDLRRAAPRDLPHIVDETWNTALLAAFNPLRQRRVQESAMKLSSIRVERTLSQIEAQAIPEDHPVIPKLNSLFGDHTFFLDNNGLNIVEPTDTGQKGEQTGTVVNLASWSEGNPTSLEPHDPEPTDVVVALGPDKPDTTH
jgi:hypothetical protein